jgi:hypothetical protein
VLEELHPSNVKVISFSVIPSSFVYLSVFILDFDSANLFFNSYLGMQVCQVLTRFQFVSYFIRNTVFPHALAVLC